MGEELVFTVIGNEAVAATPISLAEAGLKEREHLQEWVLANPGILGGDVLIITSEFDNWVSRGGAERDLLDTSTTRPVMTSGRGAGCVGEIRRVTEFETPPGPAPTPA